MALTVNTNLAAMYSVHRLTHTNTNLSSTFERISSGYRINRAADDAAGLGVAENLNAARRSLQVAMRNASDGVSLIQVAEGATQEVSQIIKRVRELAIQSSSDTLADDERQFVQFEFEQLTAEVSRIAQTTNFNGVQFGNGSTTSLQVQVGIFDTADDRITISVGDLRSTTLGIDTTALDLSTVNGARTALTALDDALNTVNGYRSAYGSVQNRLDSAIRNINTYTENLTAAESSIRDADFAYETAEMSKLQIMQQAGTAVLAQANQINQGAVRLIGG